MPVTSQFARSALDSSHVDRTLERIGYAGSRQPSVRTLGDLQGAFLLHVPFENLDIHLGREITLSPERTYEKIVDARRGGFCYECNGLFSELLAALGFRVRMLSARMALDGSVGPEYDHMVLLVELAEAYLVDVGNGQSCREPLHLDGSNESTSEGRAYRVGSHESALALYCRDGESDWAPRFLFDTKPRERSAFAEMCRYHQTSPDSPFTQKRLISLATRNGRVTLSDMRLVMTNDGRREERDLESDAEYVQCLRDRFGVELGD